MAGLPECVISCVFCNSRAVTDLLTALLIAVSGVEKNSVIYQLIDLKLAPCIPASSAGIGSLLESDQTDTSCVQ